MSKEMLLVVEALSNERNIDKDTIFLAMEEALAMATKKIHRNDEMQVRVDIDRKTGEYLTHRFWEVVADDAEIEMPDAVMMLTEANKNYEGVNIGDLVEEPMESIEFGRIAVQTAKQVIIQKVREAERQRVINMYKNRLGELVNVTVKRLAREVIIVDLGENAEAILPRRDTIDRESFRLNDRVRAVVEQIGEDSKGQMSVLLSRTSNNMLEQLLKLEVPEIGEGIIQVQSIAREPGARAKISVRTNDGRIDAVGACVGMRGSRIQAISGALNGERIDVVPWDENPAQFVINAMSPTEVSSIVLDEENESMDVIVAKEHLALAIGRNGQNVKLASALTGWHLNVMAEDEAEQKQVAEQQAIERMFIEQLQIEASMAQSLAQAGFTDLEEVAYAEEQELSSIPGVDDSMIEHLRTKAKDSLLSQALTGKTITPSIPAADLLSLEGVEREFAFKLANVGIITRDDLAEQSVDDLLDVTEGLDSEAAGKLIMKARAHWFEEDKA